MKDLKAKNRVCYIKNPQDIEKLDSFNISKSIKEDIERAYQDEKSVLLEYFIENASFERLYILIGKEKNLKQEVLFLGKHLSKLPESFTLFLWESENIPLLLETTLLSRYKFQNYKSEKKKDNLEVFIESSQKKIVEEVIQKVENIKLARDLWETPACDLTPEIFATMVKKAKFHHTKVKVLTYKDIQKKWLGLLEAVGKGSDNKPCMVILEHIVDKKNPILGIVGKWVTFDTGGNQIKPGDFMYEMKGDMWGAAVTFALMKELDRKKCKKNIVACLVLAENVLSSNSYKPSDILKAYNGKTVEIIHTDAEGRLVLADGISYLWKNYKTEKIITIATLTGACMVALGYRYAGVMWTDEELIEKLVQYGKENTEQYIELPFDDMFLEKTKSEIADYKNLDRSVHAGASMGAAFLANFLENKEAYTHIDIAGVYINGGEAYGKCPKTMTWFWVESLWDVLSTL